MVEYITPVYACVLWDGTNIEELQECFPRFQFGQSGDDVTVSGPGFTGTVSSGSYLYAVPPPANLSISFSNPADGIHFMQAAAPPSE